MGAELVGLDARAREVLASVVVAYIRSATPVSSRQLTKEGTFSLSGASLRNVMADLEDLGFLTHPHVSAGRVPTDRGYRAFVEELMTTREPTPEERGRISSDLDPEPVEVDRFLHATSRVLSLLTGEVGVVAAPDSLRFVLNAVHFARVGERRVLAVQVSSTGLVDSRLVETREDYGALELERIGRRLTVDYGGLSLAEIRRKLLEALEQEKLLFDAALKRTLELGRKTFAGEREGSPTVFVEGTEQMLEKPEFQRDVEALRRLFRTFDEKAKLVSFLTDCVSGSETAVIIGSESPVTREAQGAIVAASYGAPGRPLGVLAVIGPRRMEYSRVLPLVQELGCYVSRRMSEEGS